MTSPEKLATPETVRKALQRAYSLGQTYWQQADSESFSQNRKADETAAKFQALVEEAVACVLATQRQGEGENRKIAQLIIDNDRAGAVKWATGLIGNFDGPSCRIDPDATSQGVAVAQPDAPPCETCNGNGMIGGPCYREPDEGGVPCPDCGPAGAAQGEVN